MEKNNKRIIFNLPEDITIVDAINDILKSNGLEESDEEYLKKSQKNEDTHLTIIKNAAIAIYQKKISEKKLTELLEEHLETSKETAEKIVNNIKEKLIPYVKTLNLEEEKETTQEPLESPEEEKLQPGAKKVDITNVEENAENVPKYKKLSGEKENTTTKEKIKKVAENKFVQEKRGPDPYREPIE